MTEDKVMPAVYRALDKLKIRDLHLLLINSSERSMSHRLAVYLENEFPSYNVDCEYNREGKNIKNLILDQQVSENVASANEAITVFPDIIVHRRGNNNDNLLVIEMKKASSSISPDFDFAKLTAFREQLNYKYCVHVTIGYRHGDELTWNVDWR